METRDRIERAAHTLDRPITIMEVCGTHTVSIFRQGLRGLLPANLRLISGPGCPVCVTSRGYIDAVVELAGRDGVIVATYGDMVRVPGARGSLQTARAGGARVETVLSATDAVELARANPSSTVVFAAVGFETTAPATAAAILAAQADGLSNFLVLAAHKFVIPAMRALLDGGEVRLDGFLCPGHVSVIIGLRSYEPIVRDYGLPCVVAGFEPMQILGAVALIEELLVARQPQVANVYKSVVTDAGNPHARRLIDTVFEPGEAQWRGLGPIAASGMVLRPAYRRFDAADRFGLTIGTEDDPPGCRCGEVIKGLIDPPQCGLFAGRCTSSDPVGPCMVSSEGTCAAWFKYGRKEVAGAV